MGNDEQDLSVMVRAYGECLLWQGLSLTEEESGTESVPLDSLYSLCDIAPEAWESIRADCRAFVAANAADLAELDASQTGHDFCLTRNRHGVGFWDRGLGARGDRLTVSAHGFGESGEYDSAGRVYVS